MATVYRITVQLSEFEMRKLICWAKAHGRPKATYAGQIIGSRVEANVKTIDDMMSDIASHEGISVTELEQRWLEEEGYGASVEVGEI